MQHASTSLPMVPAVPPSADLVALFEESLAQYPDALVAAVGDDGIFVPMPPSVPLVDHRVVVGRSAIDMVIGLDKVEVITTWERCRQFGGANAVVHLAVDPDQPVLLTLCDARRVHGAFLALFVPAFEGGRGFGHNSATAVWMPRSARVRKTELAVITDIDEATSRILGWRREDMVGKRSLEFIHPDDQERAISNWMEMLTAPGHEQRVRLRHLAADGSWVWMEITNRNLLRDPADPSVLCEMLDVSEELAAQEALRASEQRLRRLAEALPVGVVQVEADRTVSYVNERFGGITGAAEGSTIAARFVHLAEEDRAAFERAVAAVLDDGADQDLQVRVLRDDGDVRQCTVAMRALTADDDRVLGTIICVSDATEQIQLTAELERRATYDGLTGCLNRPSVVSMLEHLLAEPGSGVGIVYVDLDGFKDVNDTLGHAAGDRLLAEVGERLRTAVRPVDHVGRIGGDEFLVVCPDVARLDEVRRVGVRIDRAFERRFALAEEPVEVHASLGLAHASGAGETADRLVAEADAAMYAAKHHRRPPSEPGGPLGRRRASDQLRALERALSAGELAVHYQPVVELADGSLHGAEALLRWHRDGRLVPAGEFIDQAERSGLIVELGRWVVDEVAAAMASLSGAPWLRWHLNTSPRELAATGAAERLLGALAARGVPASRLVVEVTEHADLDEHRGAAGALHDLVDAGVGVALDDFGTGWSSLALLRSLPVTCIKFDRSFTADVTTDPVAAHVLAACAELSGRLDLSLVAEGVETAAQVEHLLAAGVRLGQGFYYSPARPLAELAAMVDGECRPAAA